jgi:predicted MFS family arabinose efflux permease
MSSAFNWHWIVGLAGLIAALAALCLWALLRGAASADERIERAFREWMDRP